jgi:signal transduction histidine kinase
VPLIGRASLRRRVTVSYVLAAAVVLALVGVAVHEGVRARLMEALDEGLETRATVVARLLVETGTVRPGVTRGIDDPGETFTQVVGPGEQLRSSTPGLPSRPLLDAAGRLEAGDGATIRLPGVEVHEDDEPFEELDLEALEETGSEPFETDRARVVARQVRVGGERLAIITGATFEDRDESLSELRTVLYASAGPALLLLAAAGLLAIRGALRPVERMRRRAAQMQGLEGGELPVPPGDDELARLGRTLNELLARARQAVEHERALVADVSHELRTPLAVISGELELALGTPGTPEEAAGSMRVAAGEAQRLARIAEDLLLLARADRGALTLRREPLDAAALLEETRRRFGTRADVRVQAAGGLRLDGDRVRLGQALGNLVDNALAHGGGAVDLSAQPGPDGGVVLAVRDHGPGFDPAFLPRAFERFSRAAEGRSGPGTGLGLAIVELVATAHGGRAEARNAPDGGAEVRLVLPA